MSFLLAVACVSCVVIYRYVGRQFRDRDALAPGAWPLQRWFGRSGGPYVLWYRRADSRGQIAGAHGGAGAGGGGGVLDALLGAPEGGAHMAEGAHNAQLPSDDVLGSSRQRQHPSQYVERSMAASGRDRIIVQGIGAARNRVPSNAGASLQSKDTTRTSDYD